MRVLAHIEQVHAAPEILEPAEPGLFLRIDVPAALAVPGQEIDVTVRVRVQSVLGAST